MVIVEDSYVSIKYAKNFQWLNSGGREGEGPNDGHGGDDQHHHHQRPVDDGLAEIVTHTSHAHATS